jgi:hypothetical protein
MFVLEYFSASADTVQLRLARSVILTPHDGLDSCKILWLLISDNKNEYKFLLLYYITAC